MDELRESYSRRALGVARKAIDHAKDAEVAVSDVVAYVVAIYGNRKYQDGFADARRMEDGHGQLQQDA